MQRIFITGTAGFIGFHLAELLLSHGLEVHGYDGMTDYYDVQLKRRRHQHLLQNPGFAATEGMLEDDELLRSRTRSFISPRRPASATASSIRALTSTPMSSGPSTSSRSPGRWR